MSTLQPNKQLEVEARPQALRDQRWRCLHCNFQVVATSLCAPQNGDIGKRARVGIQEQDDRHGAAQLHHGWPFGPRRKNWPQLPLRLSADAGVRFLGRTLWTSNTQEPLIPCVAAQGHRNSGNDRRSEDVGSASAVAPIATGRFGFLLPRD